MGFDAAGRGENGCSEFCLKVVSLESGRIWKLFNTEETM